MGKVETIVLVIVVVAIVGRAMVAEGPGLEAMQSRVGCASPPVWVGATVCETLPSPLSAPRSRAACGYVSCGCRVLPVLVAGATLLCSKGGAPPCRFSALVLEVGSQRSCPPSRGVVVACASGLVVIVGVEVVMRAILNSGSSTSGAGCWVLPVLRVDAWWLGAARVSCWARPCRFALVVVMGWRRLFSPCREVVGVCACGPVVVAIGVVVVGTLVTV